jgi:hypothetical protein
MKLITIVGILLTAIGVISLTYHGIPLTTRERVLQFGPIEAYKERKIIPVSPILGVLAIAGGILLIVTGVRKK